MIQHLFPYYNISFSASCNPNSNASSYVSNISLNDLGKKIIEKYEKELYSDENYFDYTTILRDDVNLVQAVIELNPKGLKVIEIPDDVIEWYIREEDNGIESIHEVHRFWF